ncbi:MAG: hypothetical protein MZW92_25070 [Comamonadaceae bacterium]|nr:hypothetical protein [Comamonadaceae bacterium]
MGRARSSCADVRGHGRIGLPEPADRRFLPCSPDRRVRPHSWRAWRAAPGSRPCWACCWPSVPWRRHRRACAGCCPRRRSCSPALWTVLATAPSTRRDTWTALGLIGAAWLFARWTGPIELRYAGFIALGAIVLALRLGPDSRAGTAAAGPRSRAERRIAPALGLAYTAAILADEIVRWLQWAGAPGGAEAEAAARSAALLPLAAVSSLPGALVLPRLGERTRGAREAYASLLAGTAPLAALEDARRAWRTQTQRALIELATVQAIATLLALALAPVALASWGLGPTHAAAFDGWLVACGLQVPAAAVPVAARGPGPAAACAADLPGGLRARGGRGATGGTGRPAMVAGCALGRRRVDRRGMAARGTRLAREAAAHAPRIGHGRLESGA